ncbi:polyprenyl synthetase family protein [Amycolatopsis sp. lyj-84]|uniref:polyprenyl synthetase family protein n=1 Tax=Amycolatopsis sp. lyj-84 TaxID=2789284 RepID=UPI00397D6B04
MTAVRDRLTLLVGGMTSPIRDAIGTLASRPGKQLRSTLLSACAGYGPADADRVTAAGAVVELLHLASLVHDDLIDRAAVRRGTTAVHVAAGSDLAVLAGLSCFSAAGTEAAELGEDVALVVSRTVAELSHGELLDVERGFDTLLPLADYTELVGRKTGALFRLCCLLGAMESGVDADCRNALGEFGQELGVAFQILDDCLDLESDGADKPVGTDHLLGLFGAPTLAALRADTTGELSELLLSVSFGAPDLAEVRRLVAHHGGLETARELASVHYGRAKAALSRTVEGPARDSVTDVAEAVWSGRS